MVRAHFLVLLSSLVEGMLFLFIFGIICLPLRIFLVAILYQVVEIPSSSSFSE
jgi:hypothetical protein